MRPNDAHIYLHDANFNVTALLQPDSTVIERYSYTPYGEATVLNADFSLDSSGGGDGLSDVGNEILYTGRWADPTTGLQLNRNRWYHQQLGRWVSRDPIGYEGGTKNLYEYVKSKPLSGLDPYGLFEGLTCEEQDIENMRDQTRCLNEADDDFHDFYGSCRDSGGSIEDCKKNWSDEFYKRTADCRLSFPDLDCDDTCYFDPGPCATLALAVAAWDGACSFLPYGTSIPCKLLNPFKDDYEECLMTKGIRN